MEQLDILRDLIIVFAVAGVTVFVFHRLRLPSVVGLLVAGMLTGPYGLSLINEVARVETLAEIGVVVLLFAVGLEFSLPRLVGMGRLMALVGAPQVLICVLVGLLATGGYLGDARPALFVGILLAMSSTAVVFKLLGDRGELSTPHGSVAAAVLLFQDLLVVVCMLLLPLLADRRDEHFSATTSILYGGAVVVLMLAAGRYVVPYVLFQIVRTNNRELFLIALVLMCLGGAALTASMGWSLALGAFLAGLALSESEYATQTIAEVLPFRDTLASLFFISVGMLLDLSFVVSNVPLVTLTVLAVVLLKLLAALLPTLLAGYPLRIGILAGLTLAQVGEFSFILAKRGQELELLHHDQYQVFLAAAVLSIMLTPLLIAAGPTIVDAAARQRLFRRHFEAAHVGDVGEAPRHSHVIICGFGLNGRHLARVLRVVDIDYVALELNPETVRRGRRDGEPLVYGDCTRASVLEHVGIRAARLFVVAISDPISSRRAVEVARRLNSELQIIVRTRYLAEVDELRRLGANVIIPEEFETAVEIFAQVLREFEVPRNLILDLIDRVRRDHYEVLRNTRLSATKVELPYDILEQLEIESCLIQAGTPSCGRTLRQLQLRSVSGATLMAIRRGDQLLLNPGPDEPLQAGDIALLTGDRPQVDAALCLLNPQPSEPRTSF